MMTQKLRRLLKCLSTNQIIKTGHISKSIKTFASWNPPKNNLPSDSQCHKGNGVISYQRDPSATIPYSIREVNGEVNVETTTTVVISDSKRWYPRTKCEEKAQSNHTNTSLFRKDIRQSRSCISV